jgi:hypothetical protein
VTAPACLSPDDTGEREMRELVTERCRILAPKKLTALLGEEACARPDHDVEDVQKPAFGGRGVSTAETRSRARTHPTTLIRPAPVSPRR